jgi:hypothetical protein
MNKKNVRQFILGFLAGVVLVIPLFVYSAPSLIERVKGRLLLQVEQGGRIWYVSPDDGKRYEVTFGNAMSLFRKLALGISDADLNQLPMGATLPNQLLDAKYCSPPGFFTSTITTVCRSPESCDFVADGVADEATIQAALNSLPRGGTVYLQKGTYNLAGPISMTDYQRLVGEGKASILRAGDNFNQDMIRTDTTPDSSRRGLEVSNLKIDGNRGGANNNTGRCIYMFNVRNSIFRNLWVTECEEEAIFLDGGPHEIGWLNLVEGSEIDNSDAGIRFRYTEHNVVAHNYISWIDGHAFYGESDMDIVDSNFFDAIGGNGVRIEFGAGQWRITNNSFERMGSHSIVTRRTPYVTITNNYIEVSSNTYGILNGEYMGEGSDYMVVKGNTFHARDGTAGGTTGIKEGAATTDCIYSDNQLSEMTTAIDLDKGSIGTVVN